MSPDRKECEAQALKLPAEDRAALAAVLIESLDTLDDAENERLWLQEAERRYREYKKGNLPAKPAEDVLKDARTASQ